MVMEHEICFLWVSFYYNVALRKAFRELRVKGQLYLQAQSKLQEMFGKKKQLLPKNIILLNFNKQFLLLNNVLK